MPSGDCARPVCVVTGVPGVMAAGALVGTGPVTAVYGAPGMGGLCGTTKRDAAWEKVEDPGDCGCGGRRVAVAGKWQLRPGEEGRRNPFSSTSW